MEKKLATYLTIATLANQARAIPGMRVGQYVCNTLFPEYGSGTAKLFYCRDDKFWEIITEFVEIV
jgi:hypothetical protein